MEYVSLQTPEYATERVPLASSQFASSFVSQTLSGFCIHGLHREKMLILHIDWKAM